MQSTAGHWRLVLTLLMASAWAEGNDVPAVLSEDSEQAAFSLVLVATGFDYPWDMEFLPDGDLLVSEYDGRLRVLPGAQAHGQSVVEAIADTTENGGLRGISAHPRFQENGLLYLCYATGTVGENFTRIVRGQFDGTSLRNRETVFEADNRSSDLLHYGCRMNWLPDGTLLATLGDRYHHKDEAQEPGNHYGVAVRINDDGSVPDDNPYLGNDSFRKEIWAYGVRNSQGAVFHPETGELWSSDHGPYGGDEINIVRPGQNYGWPNATYGIDYDRTIISETPLLPGTKAPLFYWYPSVAPSSIAFYTGRDFPKWRHDLFVTTLAKKRLLRLELHGDRIVRVEELLADLDVRLRDVTMGPDGIMYILSDAGDGRLFKFAPTATAGQ